MIGRESPHTFPHSRSLLGLHPAELQVDSCKKCSQRHRIITVGLIFLTQQVFTAERKFDLLVQSPGCFCIYQTVVDQIHVSRCIVVQIRNLLNRCIEPESFDVPGSAQEEVALGCSEEGSVHVDVTVRKLQFEGFRRPSVEGNLQPFVVDSACVVKVSHGTGNDEVVAVQQVARKLNF